MYRNLVRCSLRQQIHRVPHSFHRFAIHVAQQLEVTPASPLPPMGQSLTRE